MMYFQKFTNDNCIVFAKIKLSFLHLHSNIFTMGARFLIRNFFEKKDVLFFDVTGSKDGPMADQIKHFTIQIGKIFIETNTSKHNRILIPSDSFLFEPNST